jgi:sugar O-acyltransferase (sialic acid O-acetyltransferase NeuD family)
MKTLIGIFGSGGFGREVIPLVEQQVAFSSEFPSSTHIVFVVDEVESVAEVNGYKVMSLDDFCSDNTQLKKITITVANNTSRKLIYQRICDKNISLLSVKALNSVQLQYVEVGEGAILCPFTTITSNVKIGKCFQANIYSYIAHDCVVGDFVTFAPSVKCNGNVVIEDNVYVGTGAIIKQGKKGNPIILGKGSKIEAGSYVTKNVEPGTTVFGNPAVEMTPSNLRKLKSSS